jgi:hypothetical protein
MNRKTLIATIIAAALVVPAAGFAEPLVDGPANIVRVENAVDQTVKTKARFQIGRVSARDTEAGNLAYANSHDCTGCQSLAAAYQAVFLSSENHNFSPQNAAVAVNTTCSGCGSFAYAYQYVVTADRSARLREGDREAVAALRREASDALRSGLAYPDVDARLKDIAARFRAVIDAAVARSDVDVDRRRSNERQDAESFDGER